MGLVCACWWGRVVRREDEERLGGVGGVVGVEAGWRSVLVL